MNQEESDAFDLDLAIDIHLRGLSLSTSCATNSAWWLKIERRFPVILIRLHFLAIECSARSVRNHNLPGSKQRLVPSWKTNSKCGLEYRCNKLSFRILLV